jgi:YgiT-type zinc finger domain-containing protein
MNPYDFPCEYCPGTVRERILDREPINHHRGIVILEHVPIGVCDRCGAHYIAAPVLKRAEAILKGNGPAARTMTVPVENYQA